MKWKAGKLSPFRRWESSDTRLMLMAQGKIFMLKTLTNFRDVFVPSLIR